jgi:broad specificity phosphatase PhoE
VNGVALWPASLTLVRHGESAGNVARDAAEANGDAVIDIALRDMDVPLSERGEAQAEGLARWLVDSSHPTPAVILTSPYVRAARTAEILRDRAQIPAACVLDERLREREFGVLDRLTRAGIELRYPDQAEARARVGKFYYRPPGGESWCDVALRVRSVIESVSREYAGMDVLVVAHQVVILMFRYALEHLSEAEILEIGRDGELANCSVTAFGWADANGSNGLTLQCFNEVVPLEDTGAPVTAEPDVPLAPR